MESRLKMMVFMLRIGAVFATIGVFVMALLIASFAMDPPDSTKANALLAGAAVLLLTLPVTALPLWAAHQIKRHGMKGLMASVVYAVLILAVFPLGTILGGALLVMAWKARQAAQC